MAMNLEPQKNLLSECYLAGRLDAPPAGLLGVLRAVRYQAARLGLAMPSTGTNPALDGLAWSFGTPSTAPVTVQVHGWPQGGQASEFLAQAASGLMGIHGRSSGGSRPLGLNHVSNVTAVLALQGAMAAALGQLRGGHFTKAVVSLGSAALLCTGQYLAGATAPDAPETLWPGSHPPTQQPPFISLDGVAFELEALDAQPWQRFWHGLAVDPALAGKGWNGFLLRYAKAMAPLPDGLMATLAGLPYSEIAERCAKAGLAICPVRSLEDRARDADARAMWEQGPWAFTAASATSADCGVHPLGLSDALPLQGLKVIESCRRIQGPLAGHMLALLGAEVIRLEPPGGDPLRAMAPMAGNVSARFDALNRLKAVQEVDIKTSAGRETVRALVRDADVFLHNWAPGKAAELALDDVDLAGVNPGLVYAYAGGWGASRHAPDLPGTDFMAQAYSGLACVIAAQSGLRGGSLFTVLDLLGGVVAAQGITAALLARALRPARYRVDTSLLGAATLLSAEQLGAQWPDTALPAAEGEAQAQQWVVPTASGLLAIECPDAATLQRLGELLKLPAMAQANRVRAALFSQCLGDTAAHWLVHLQERGIPACLVTESLADIQQQQPLLASALSRPVGTYARIHSPWSLS